MIGLWVQARTLYHALTADNDLPPTKKEHDGNAKPNWPKMGKARKSRQEHDEEWQLALSSPQHFGTFLGMGSILGEPPQEPVKTGEDVEREIEDKLEAGFSAMRRVLRSFGEQNG